MSTQGRWMNARFGPEHLDAWRRDGGVLIEGFFTPEEVAAVRADFAKVFARTEGADEGLNRKHAGEIGRFNAAQFATLESIPFDCSPALNLIGVHPELMRLAREALSTDALHL